jgi:hypothetical protein
MPICHLSLSLPSLGLYALALLQHQCAVSSGCILVNSFSSNVPIYAMYSYYSVLWPRASLVLNFQNWTRFSMGMRRFWSLSTRSTWDFMSRYTYGSWLNQVSVKSASDYIIHSTGLLITTRHERSFITRQIHKLSLPQTLFLSVSTFLVFQWWSF